MRAGPMQRLDAGRLAGAACGVKQGKGVVGGCCRPHKISVSHSSTHGCFPGSQLAERGTASTWKGEAPRAR